MRRFHYVDRDGQLIRIQTRLRPSRQTMPKSGAWVVTEFVSGVGWKMPDCPEVTWGTLSRLEYIGSIPMEKPHDF